ncbi:MAG: transporter substrate-binding domain-containing protein [Desulfobacterales bacterium]|nr:transporter substrate-binding domain-containing protein [Desulfobacterales bacterium]
MFYCLILLAILGVNQLAVAQTSDVDKQIVVLVKPISPFVIIEHGNPSGFSIDLWRELAVRANFKTTYQIVDTLAELLDGIENDSADAAIAAVTITRGREAKMDFSHSYFHSGLQVLVRSSETGIATQVLEVIGSILTSQKFIAAIFSLFIMLIVAAHIIWLLERRRNKQFAKSYWSGIWDSLWWSLVTVTTVGYGDKTPRTHRGRAFAIIWIIFGYLGFVWFTAIVSSTVTVSRLTSSITGPDSLAGHRVGTVRRSTSAAWLSENVPGARILLYNVVDKAYDDLIEGEIDAVVYDAPSVLYFSSHRGKSLTHPVGPVFHKEEYGIAIPEGSPLVEKINQALLGLIEDGTYTQLYQKWFESVSLK